MITSSSSSEVSKPIISDFRLRKLSFTGSTEVGRKLMEQSAEQLLRVSMELGGNAPFLVFDDADLDAAVEGAMIAKMRNIGEACTAANRFYVAESIAQEFVERLAERMAALKVGRGTEEGVEVGPLINEEQLLQGRGAGRGRTRPGREAASSAASRVDMGRLLLPADRADRRPRRRAPAEGGDLRSGRAGQGIRRTRRRRSAGRTTPSTASSPTSTRATSAAPSG